MEIYKKKSKNACFIHSTNIDLNKTEILEYLVNYLNNLEFIDKMDFLFINNIGIEINEDHFKKINDNKFSNIIIVNYSNDNNLFENCTLKQLYSFSKLNPDYKILYLHTKGVSHDKTHKFYKGIISWINYMLYCLVDNYESCINILQDVDVIGCNYRIKGENPIHFSGNYWWATSNYINKLSIVGLNTKYDAEFWLFGKNPSYFNIHTLNYMYENNYPQSYYKNSVINNFKIKENKINNPTFTHCLLGWKGIGLCNQLFSLVSCIFDNINKNGIKIIVLYEFLNDIETNIYSNSSEIFDLEIINIFLAKYNIILLDKYKSKLEIIDIKYGIDDNNIDITEKIVKKYYNSNENSLIVPINTNINKLYYDPEPGIVKFIYVKYKINNMIFNNIFLENSQIELNNLNSEKKHKQNEITIENKKNIKLFDIILKNITFNKKYYNIANSFIRTLNITEKIKINIIHIRNELDAITFWGNINKIKPVKYKEILENKYIYLIEKYLDKNSHNIVLSMNTDNKVIDYLKHNNYNYNFINKNNCGREINAIIDLIISNKCNNVFIGNIHPINFNGSTFSYCIYKMLDDHIKKILIDLDNINHEEYVL
jgi:hypothetical protein